MVFYFLSKTLDVLVAPYTWVMLLLVWALLQFRKRQRRRGQRAILYAFVIIYVSSTGCTASLLTSSLEAHAHNTMKPDVTYDAVVLLGGVMEARSNPPSYNDAIERLLVTYDILRMNRAKFAIISSGIDGRGESEAALLARQLQSWGIDSSRLILEEESHNTHNNAFFTKRIATARNFNTLLLITSAMHMKRAAGCFKAEGLRPDLLPVDYRTSTARFYKAGLFPRARPLSDTTDAIREAFGWVVYRAIGWAK